MAINTVDCGLEIVNRQSKKSAIFSPQSAVDLADHQFAFHPLAAIVDREIAVEAVGADLVGAEFEDDGLAGTGALGDAVLVNREAVSDVLRRKRDLDEIVFLHLDAARLERELIAGNGEFARDSLAGRLE